jgi:hypothetical protein
LLVLNGALLLCDPYRVGSALTLSIADCSSSRSTLIFVLRAGSGPQSADPNELPWIVGMTMSFSSFAISALVGGPILSRRRSPR